MTLAQSRIHAISKFVAAYPKGEKAFGFLDGHILLPFLWCLEIPKTNLYELCGVFFVLRNIVWFHDRLLMETDTEQTLIVHHH